MNALSAVLAVYGIGVTCLVIYALECMGRSAREIRDLKILVKKLQERK